MINLGIDENIPLDLDDFVLFECVGFGGVEVEDLLGVHVQIVE